MNINYNNITLIIKGIQYYDSKYSNNTHALFPWYVLVMLYRVILFLN